MYFFETWNMPGDLNMALDVVLGRMSFEMDEAFLRLYSWERPTVSFGKHQEVTCPGRYVCVVRPTGGRAVLHWKEITYSLVFPRGWVEYSLSVLGLYRRMSEIFSSAFRRLGIPVEVSEGFGNLRNPNCFSSGARYELTVSGRKFMGSAQMRTREFVLQHGSILLEYDERAVEEVFGDSGRAVGLMEVSRVGLREIVDSLLEEFDSTYGLKYFGYSKVLRSLERAESFRGDFVCRSCS